MTQGEGASIPLLRRRKTESDGDAERTATSGRQNKDSDEDSDEDATKADQRGQRRNKVAAKPDDKTAGYDHEGRT
ncbi:hypothetical protein, partial [Streptomyces sp. NPDC059159]|uniref:hypothetical protein n=1 Tax=Streptomyces sp. NPDC059159 TaxID=3346747 RepID=UPI003679A93B